MYNLYCQSPDISLFLEGLLAACKHKYVHAQKLQVNILVKFVQEKVWLDALTILT